MRDVAMMWVLVVVVLGLGLAEAGRELHPLFDSPSREELVALAGYGEEKLSTVVITGSVLCPDHEASTLPQPVSGVRVGVTCTSVDQHTKKSTWEEETVTDEFGDFALDLPSHLHGTQNLDETCQVKVVRVSANPHCKGSFATMEHKGMIKLSSAGNGVRTYSVGKINLQRLNKPKAVPIILLAKLPNDKWRD